MAVYTTLSEQDLRALTGRFELTLVDYEPVEAGSANSNYLLRTQQGAFMLTLFDDVPLAHVLELGRLLGLLEAHAIPTTPPITTPQGEAAILHNGKPVMVKRYVPGHVTPHLDAAMLRQVGAAMAHLHQVPYPDFLSIRPSFGLRKRALIQGQGPDPAYEAWIEQRLADLQSQEPAGLPHGLIHGDIFYDNLVFAGDKLNAIIDFEEATYSALVFDLGMAVVGLCPQGAAVVMDHARRLINGYQQVRRLTHEEQQALQFYITYAATMISCWRYWIYHIDKPNPKKADKHREMVRMAADVSAISKDTFLAGVFS